jgi:hypothetical protein
MGQPSHLFFGTHRLLSSSGNQQGDPLASLLFSLALQPLIKRIQECPELFLNVWFLNNGTSVGHLKDLLKILNLLNALRVASASTRQSPLCGVVMTTPSIHIHLGMASPVPTPKA